MGQKEAPITTSVPVRADFDSVYSEAVLSTGNDRITAKSVGELRNFKKQHRWDPFLDQDDIQNIDIALESGDLEKEDIIDASIQDNSPYPEVRAAVCPLTYLTLKYSSMAD